MRGGKYIAWVDGHFTAVIVCDIVWSCDNTEWKACADLNSAYPRADTVFWQLVENGLTSTNSTSFDLCGGASPAEVDLDIAIALEAEWDSLTCGPGGAFDRPPTPVDGQHAEAACSIAGSPTTPRASDRRDGAPDSVAQRVDDEHESQPEDAGDQGGMLRCKRRRFLPHASTSDSDFKSMFQEFNSKVSVSLASVQPQLTTKDTSILVKTQALRACVVARFPAWDDHPQRLVMGVLAVYRMRTADMFLREQVLLMWIMAGGVHLRAHTGSCYFYHDDGAFVPYKGVPPENTFALVKTFLLELEGIFRTLPAKCERANDPIMDAIAAGVAEIGSVSDFLVRCTDAAIFCLGDKLRKRGSFIEDAVAPAEDGDPKAPWNIFTAQELRKVGIQLQRQLLEEKLYAYITEWCETPSPQAPGCVYTDACVLYGSGPGDTVQFVQKSPDHNIYIRVAHPLLDPVLDEARQRLERFLSQTFWCNFKVYLCCQAAQALAKRGENIDRCFIGVSPGGVGQSLYSAHLAAIYTHAHAYFDPNVWYMEEEMRKVVEQFVGCIILTGQEAPESTRKMREDLYKKTMSADGISGRKPYGIKTSMFELVGWKRLEATHVEQSRSLPRGN